jgi:hypothetical protein
MNIEKLKIKFDELINDYQPSAEIERLYHKAIASGILDISGETADDFRLPKIICYAVLQKMAADCRPLDPENRKLAEDLLLFL